MLDSSNLAGERQPPTLMEPYVSLSGLEVRDLGELPEGAADAVLLAGVSLLVLLDEASPSQPPLSEQHH